MGMMVFYAGMPEQEKPEQSDERVRAALPTGRMREAWDTARDRQNPSSRFYINETDAAIHSCDDAATVEFGRALAAEVEARKAAEAEVERLRGALEGMVRKYCVFPARPTNGVVDSWCVPEAAEAIRVLAEAGRIEITHDDGVWVTGTWLPRTGEEGEGDEG